MDALFNSSSPLQNLSEVAKSRSFKKSKKRNDTKRKIDEEENECYNSLMTIKRNQGNITPLVEISIEDFLHNRIHIFGRLLSTDVSQDNIDCITLNPISNQLIINKEIVGDKNITINKYIGSGSYGIVFNNDDGDTRYAIKFIKHSNNHFKEIEITKQISINNYSSQIPNFIYTAYYKLNCNKIEIKEEKREIEKTLNQCLSIQNENGTYSMIVLEYLDGTINEIIRPKICKIGDDDENIEIFKSIYSQAILALFIFHNKFKYFHNDAHSNNFFFKKVIKNNKYFHYKINDNNFYVKNVGYLVVLADYGLAEPINMDDEYNKKIFNDYNKILSDIHSLCLFKYKKYYETKKSIISNLMQLINKISVINELDFIKEILTKFYDIHKIPEASEIINSNPYTCNY
jgi:hypothetical protein